MEFIDQKIPKIKMEVNVENLKIPEIQQKEIRDKAASDSDKYFGFSSTGSTCMPSSILKGSKNSIWSDRHGSLSAVKVGEILKNTYEGREFFDHGGLVETQGMKAKDVTCTPIKKRKGRSELSEEQISKWQSSAAYTGTTFIVANNSSGLYFLVDGLPFLLADSDTDEKMARLAKEKAYRRNCEKLFQLGEGMLAVVHGTNLWSEYILDDVLKAKVIKKKVAFCSFIVKLEIILKKSINHFNVQVQNENWTTKQCAVEAQHIMKTHIFSPEHLVEKKLPKDFDSRNAGCGIVFGSYIENDEKVKVGSMFYVDKDNMKEIIDVNNYPGTIQDLYNDKTKPVGYLCLGIGGEHANSELMFHHSFHQMGNMLDKNCLAVENGNLTECEHAYVFLNAMREAVANSLTGGEIIGKYITPSGIKNLVHPYATVNEKLLTRLFVIWSRK
ncbi:uncharacterized protein LOC113316575 [Papaver somniferum]|uniref:uncharacterized protein LOC113316575 n=1 Tax=Papaver somniferum TaxID=3469 RepID=UPI000E6F953E|nr:uncharacterized protein LOC113316575 [Papaver somniferum]